MRALRSPLAECLKLTALAAGRRWWSAHGRPPVPAPGLTAGQALSAGGAILLTWRHLSFHQYEHRSRPGWRPQASQEHQPRRLARAGGHRRGRNRRVPERIPAARPQARRALRERSWSRARLSVRTQSGWPARSGPRARAGSRAPCQWPALQAHPAQPGPSAGRARYPSRRARASAPSCWPRQAWSPPRASCLRAS
jgi:hypothetical protein